VRKNYQKTASNRIEEGYMKGISFWHQLAFVPGSCFKTNAIRPWPTAANVTYIKMQHPNRNKIAKSIKLGT